MKLIWWSSELYSKLDCNGNSDLMWDEQKLVKCNFFDRSKEWEIVGSKIESHSFLIFPKSQSNLNSNCSDLLDMRNIQEQVKKAFCYQKLFWPFTIWINCSVDLKIFANSRPSALNFKAVLALPKTEFIQTVKDLRNIWWKNAFLTCSWMFLRSNES